MLRGKNFRIGVLGIILLGVLMVAYGCGGGGGGSTAVLPSSASNSSDAFYTALSQHLSSASATWTAGTNAASRLSLGLAALPNKVGTPFSPRIAGTRSAFSWKDNLSKDWLTRTKDQGPYGTCVAFALIGAMEARIRISNNNPCRTYDLSEWYMFHNGGGDYSPTGGWYLDAALAYMQDNGTVLEAFCPYVDLPNYYDAKSAKANRYKISGYNWVGANTQDIKAAVMESPVVAIMEVYDDFRYYHSGVYTHEMGEHVGYHVVIIAGWDDNQACWICRNSWGENWGEGGWFRIRYGECLINDYACALGSPVTPTPRISFASDRGGNFDIYTIDQNGGNVRQVTSASTTDIRPFFSPDYSKILFSSDINPNSNNEDIWIVNVDGSGLTNLTNSSSMDEEFPSWSPDSLNLAFARRTTNHQIYRVGYDGANLIQLTNLPYDHNFARWSPDGGRIAYGSWRDGDNEIYVMNSTGGGEMQLTNNNSEDQYPAWSPDGASIAFVSRRDGGANEIYKMNADGSAQTRLTFNSSDEYTPAWSPDGQWIVFSSRQFGDGGEICKIGKDGGNITRLTNNPANDWYTAW